MKTCKCDGNLLQLDRFRRLRLCALCVSGFLSGVIAPNWIGRSAFWFLPFFFFFSNRILSESIFEMLVKIPQINYGEINKKKKSEAFCWHELVRNLALVGPFIGWKSKLIKKKKKVAAAMQNIIRYGRRVKLIVFNRSSDSNAKRTVRTGFFQGNLRRYPAPIPGQSSRVGTAAA